MSGPADALERAIVDIFVSRLDQRAAALRAGAEKAGGGSGARMLASARDLEACAAAVAALLPADRVVEAVEAVEIIQAVRFPPSNALIAGSPL